MPIKTLNDEGAEIEVYTKEEVDAINATKEQLEKDLADKEQHLQKKNEEIFGLRGQNKRLSDMTEEEKKRYSATELELKAKQEEIEDWRKKEHNGKRDRIFDKFASGNEDLRKKLGEHYELLGLPEDTDEAILKRAQYAFNNARADLGLASVDTLGASFTTQGEPPTFGTKDGASFAETEKGKQVAGAMFGDIIGKK